MVGSQHTDWRMQENEAEARRTTVASLCLPIDECVILRTRSLSSDWKENIQVLCLETCLVGF